MRTIGAKSEEGKRKTGTDLYAERAVPKEDPRTIKRRRCRFRT
jgi:hypothetical protein